MRASVPPVVVMTSNRTRELHDALKRRCLYHWIEFPDAARERAIIDAQRAGARGDAAASLVAAVSAVRSLRLIKPPGIAETIEWAQAAKLLSEEGASVAGSAAAVPRPAASKRRRTPRRCSRTPRRSGCDRERARLANDGVPAIRRLAAESRAADRLPAPRCADNEPPDIMRLYWLARVTLVAGPRVHSPLRCAVRHVLHRRPTDSRAGRARARPRRRSRSGDQELQPVQLGEGTGKDASVHELRNRRTYDATTDDLAELRKALAEHLPRVRRRRLKPSAARPPRPAPHAAPRDPHRRDHAPRPPRPPAPATAPAAA